MIVDGVGGAGGCIVGVVEDVFSVLLCPHLVGLYCLGGNAALGRGGSHKGSGKSCQVLGQTVVVCNDFPDISVGLRASVFIEVPWDAGGIERAGVEVHGSIRWIGWSPCCFNQ